MSTLHLDIDQLLQRGFVCTRQVPDTLWRSMSALCRKLLSEQKFRPASLTGQVYSPEVRSDLICWLDPQQTHPALQDWRQVTSELQNEFNRTLFSNIHEIESHFSCYLPGASYVRHLDQPQKNTARVISSVLYLNEPWYEPWGGGLILEPLDSASPVRISPRAGTWVFFLSDQVYHRVQSATFPRLALASWYRRRSGQVL